jgi:hypothetical protein
LVLGVVPGSGWVIYGCNVGMKDIAVNMGNIGQICADLVKLTMSTGKKYRLTYVEWKEKRSLSANAQCHVWYPIIAEFIGSDAKTVKARSKIDFGLPILLNSSCEYQPVLQYIIEQTKFYNMTYEQQEKMIQGIAITSKMSTPQCNVFRDNLQAYWQGHGLNLEYKK